jgi:UDP-GlcNAc:undecaprenyl-phosphate GlcNAc-1-phosphate transferase
MQSLALLSVVSFVTSLLLTPLVRDFFTGIGIVDSPDKVRKLHPRPIPRVGGIAIMAAFVFSFLVLYLIDNQHGHRVKDSLPQMVRVLPAVALIFLSGLLDDLLALKPWQKLLGQTTAACLAYWMGIRVTVVADFQFSDPWWTLPLTVIWLVGCSNAFNLIDGLDGLAAGIGFFATVTTLLAALVHADLDLAMATVPLAGALLGFLRYNFNPASVFLGDCGSLTIGFVLGCYSILWSQKSATLLGMTAPLMILAVPLLDTFLSMLRRFLRLQPIFGADRGHIHHRLLDRGLTPRRVTLIIYGVCGLAAAFSLLQSVANQHFGGVIIVLFCAVTWIGVQHLGYVEFAVAGRMISRGVFRRLLRSEIHLHHIEQSLVKASNIDECVAIVTEGARLFGFSRLTAYLNGARWDKTLEKCEPGACWELRIPITPFDQIVLLRDCSKPMPDVAIASFIEAVRTGMRTQVGATDHVMFACARG